ncbi:MAG: nucleotidyltransferase domain-containing protein [Planctomycetes bacterium]|nr:nucleotidyltransferase domain-containing protein [Planctomycetota bacterium]
MEGIRRRSRAIFARYIEISAAYLFGSVARGEARPDSDIDFGLVLRGRGESALEHHRWIRELTCYLEGASGPRPVDVVVLEPQGPLFCHQVLLDGVLLYDADPERRIDFESETLVRAFDFGPTYEIAAHGWIESYRRWLRSQG